MEKWKDIEEYEGIYQVSNMGRVRRIVATHTTKPMIRKLTLAGAGYPSVCLSKDGVTKRYIVSRLVAKAFIPNPQNKREVNHINGIKTDNRVENLEWVTSSENKIHAIRTGLRTSDSVRIPVAVYTKEGELVGTFQSMLEASQKTGIHQGSISNVLKGKRKTANGFYIDYALSD